MKIKCTLTLSGENSKSYRSKLTNFELKIMKMTVQEKKWYFFADTLLYRLRIDLYGHISLV